VEGELLDDLRRVRGKQGILFRLAEAAVAHPDETVRAALFPVVGESTLRDLVREARASETAFRARVRTVLRSSYSAHYRRLLPRLLAKLEFRSGYAAFRPALDALALLARYASRERVRFYDAPERVPLDGVVPEEWRDAVVDECGQIARIPYELCVLGALRTALRRREVWVVGAARWRDPDEDLPADFEAHRDAHYARKTRPEGRSGSGAPCGTISAFGDRAPLLLEPREQTKPEIAPAYVLLGPGSRHCRILRSIISDEREPG
jgi:hypothetical protein